MRCVKSGRPQLPGFASSNSLPSGGPTASDAGAPSPKTQTDEFEQSSGNRGGMNLRATPSAYLQGLRTLSGFNGQTVAPVAEQFNANLQLLSATSLKNYPQQTTAIRAQLSSLWNSMEKNERDTVAVYRVLQRTRAQGPEVEAWKNIVGRRVIDTFLASADGEAFLRSSFYNPWRCPIAEPDLGRLFEAKLSILDQRMRNPNSLAGLEYDKTLYEAAKRDLDLLRAGARYDEVLDRLAVPRSRL